MSSMLCRIILVDHASRRPLWDAQAATAPPHTLTPLDPRPFAPWDVSALAVVYQIGDGPRALRDAIPVLAKLQACKCRLCFAREQDYILVILEKKERTPVDVAAMAREIHTLVQATTVSADDETPWMVPADVAQPARALPLPHLRDSLPPGVRCLILVDDDNMVRSVCQRILQPHFLVFEVAGSLDVLALAERLPFPIHVLVSDINLPRMDGITLAHRWRQRCREARVLLLSGNPHAGEISPDITFLQKPFLADELVRIVTDLAQSRDKALSR